MKERPAHSIFPIKEKSVDVSASSAAKRREGFQIPFINVAMCNVR